MSRHQNKKTKRKSKIKKIFLISSAIILLLISSAVCYGYYQYKKGINLATKNIKNPNKKIEFHGVSVPEKTNILLVGEDAHKNGERSRTDSIMILQYNNNHETKLLSIMRDSYVPIPGHGSQKINAAYTFGGIELLRKTIEQNFGISFEYYAIIDFKGFEKMIDEIAPKGITIDVEKRMSSHIGVSLQPGEQQLHGKELLGYSRFRHDARGDFDRVARQQKVLSAIKDQVLSLDGIISLPKTLGVIRPYIQTNIPNMDLINLGTDFLLKGKNKKVETFRIPEDNTYTPKRYEKVGAVLDLDIEKNKEILQSLLE
jgi:LCP family protein required for cell wall assembly